MTGVVWVVDTSAIIQMKSIAHAVRGRVFSALTGLVDEGRLVFPAQVVKELRRNSDTHAPDQVCAWALQVEKKACATVATLDEVKAVLAYVPDILDDMKESGVDEADPYVLALAQRLRREQKDARVVSQETKDSPRKLSLNTACGMLGIPSVPLLGLLRAEDIDVAVGPKP